jgi:hypothetical protein
MKINEVEAASRTILMMANFLHRDPSDIDLEDDLRTDWDMTERDFPILETWIEGPISRSIPGYFQDVLADVHELDLVNPQVVSTIDSLFDLIWANIPPANKQ